MILETRQQSEAEKKTRELRTHGFCCCLVLPITAPSIFFSLISVNEPSRLTALAWARSTYRRTHASPHEEGEHARTDCPGS